MQVHEADELDVVVLGLVARPVRKRSGFDCIEGLLAGIAFRAGVSGCRATIPLEAEGAGVLILLVGSDRRAPLVRLLALVGSLLGFAATLPLAAGFDRGTARMQFVERAPWIERFDVQYLLGIDGLSIWLVMLTAFITSSITRGSAIRATPPAARISAGTRSKAMTATAPASSAIFACSALTTSMMTPPFCISAIPRLTRSVPVSYAFSTPAAVPFLVSTLADIAPSSRLSSK